MPDRYTQINQSIALGASQKNGPRPVKLWDQNCRGMWIHEREFSKEEISKGHNFKEGFYLFGGQGRDDAPLNDIWLIKPEHLTNKRSIDNIKCTYTSMEPELTLNVK